MTQPDSSIEAMREAFQVWFLAYRESTWRPLPSDPRRDMPAHWNTNPEQDCWRGWRAATQRERAHTQAARGQRDVLEKLLGEAVEALWTLHAETDEDADRVLLGQLIDKIYEARQAVQLNQRSGK